MLQIRTALNSDLAPLLQLLRTQLQEHDIVLTPQALQTATQGLIADQTRGRILCAWLDDALIGVAVVSFLWTLEHGGPAAWLDEVYVDPSRRGDGIGRQLVEAAMQVARDNGCIALDLEVDAGHEAAERLYERMKFRRHRRVRWVRMLD
jgi:GNAT superfamily N-acetyltransferase